MSSVFSEYENILWELYEAGQEGGIIDYVVLHPPVTVKFLTILLRPNIRGLEHLNYWWLDLNIFEAVLADLFIMNRDVYNALFGINLILLRPIMSKINILDCEGVKIWCILYFIWHMKLIKNKGLASRENFMNDFPTLHKVLFSFGYTPDELFQIWIHNKESSILTSIGYRYLITPTKEKNETNAIQ